VSRDREHAEELFAQGHLARALEAVKPALAAGDPEAEHLVGRIYTEGGKPGFATLLLQRAAVLRPDDPEVLASLGRAQRLAGDTADALATLEPAERTDRVWLELGEARLAAGDAAGALAAAERSADAPALRADALLALGRVEEARAAIGEDRSHVERARLRSALGDGDGARRALEAAVALRPGDPEPRHLLAAATGAPLERASDDYVRDYFDRFAETFDDQLHAIGYRPERLLGHLLARLGEPCGALTVLDAGCGTGLCGPLLRPYAGRLVGVDLSGGMLERAAARGAYDELVEAELLAFLRGTGERFDVVVASDVLIYFADLAEPFTRVAGALAPHGAFAFSTEREDGAGSALRPSGRWAHDAGAVRAAAEAARLALEVLEEVELRREFDLPLHGLFGVATPAP
jgi:predicted TPR repeat methyltransferase